MFFSDGLHLLQVLSPSHLISLLHTCTHIHILQCYRKVFHSLEKTHPHGTLACLLAARCHVLTFLCHNTRLVLINTDLLHLWQHVHVPGAAAVEKKKKKTGGKRRGRLWSLNCHVSQESILKMKICSKTCCVTPIELHIACGCRHLQCMFSCRCSVHPPHVRAACVLRTGRHGLKGCCVCSRGHFFV